MATVTPTVTGIGPMGVRVVWAGIVTGDTITPHLVSGLAIRATVQASGTFAGGTVIGLNGSVNNSTYVGLTNTSAVALSGKTAAFLEEIGQTVTAFQPTIGSGAADSVTVTLAYAVA